MSSRNQSAIRVLIPIMGATGAGKSYFINTLIREKKMAVSGGLRSCTTDLAFAPMEYRLPNDRSQFYQIELVDTPGFDDSGSDDIQILKKIADWLKSFEEGMILGGVIYLYDITAPRFDDAARRKLQIFRSLCGDDFLDKVVLGTTKWGLRVPDSDKRHVELETEHWKHLIEKGAHTRRFLGDYESACSLIDAILPGQSKTLQIQKEMANPRTHLSHTSAGKRAGMEPSQKFPAIISAAFRPFRGIFSIRRSYA